MTSQAEARFVVADRVKILTSPGWAGRVVEVRGAFSPSGAMVYRVRLRCPSPRPIHIEVRDDELELIPNRKEVRIENDCPAG